MILLKLPFSFTLLPIKIFSVSFFLSNSLYSDAKIIIATIKLKASAIDVWYSHQICFHNFSFLKILKKITSQLAILYQLYLNHLLFLIVDQLNSSFFFYRQQCFFEVLQHLLHTFLLSIKHHLLFYLHSS